MDLFNPNAKKMIHVILHTSCNKSKKAVDAEKNDDNVIIGQVQNGAHQHCRVDPDEHGLKIPIWSKIQILSKNIFHIDHCTSAINGDEAGFDPDDKNGVSMNDENYIIIVFVVIKTNWVFILFTIDSVVNKKNSDEKNVITKMNFAKDTMILLLIGSNPTTGMGAVVFILNLNNCVFDVIVATKKSVKESSDNVDVKNGLITNNNAGFIGIVKDIILFESKYIFIIA